MKLWQTLVLVATGGILCAVLFVLDLMGRFNVASVPIAVLKMADGTVKRLGKDQLTWDRALGGTLFGAGDTIATGESARARLTFYAGTEIDLDPGAMVTLSGGPESLSLNFLSGGGRVRVTKAAQGKVKIQASNPVAREALKVKVVEKIAATVSRSEEAPIEPPHDAQKQLAASARIEEKQIRNPGRTLASLALKGQGGILTAADLPDAPQVLGPPPDQSFDLKKDHAARLQWKQSEKTPAKAFEVSLRPLDGKSPARTLTTRDPALPIAALHKGTYLWSVRAVMADGKRSPASEGRMIDIKAEAVSQLGRPVVLPVRVVQ